MEPQNSATNVLAQARAVARGPSMMIVDGLNLIRLDASEAPRLDVLLTVLLEICLRVEDFICVFDANTPFILRDAARPGELAVYRVLMRYHRRHFVECTGGTVADDIILAEADSRGARVLSNDRFRKYRHRYPWVRRYQRMVRVNRVRDNIHIGRWRRQLPNDLLLAASELKRQLQLRGTPSDIVATKPAMAAVQCALIRPSAPSQVANASSVDAIRRELFPHEPERSGNVYVYYKDSITDQFLHE